MGRVRRPRMSAREKVELWKRWKRGESLSDIGRALGRIPGAVHHVVSARGGMPPPSRTRSRRSLTLTERDEISRGLARGYSVRQIGVRLSRAPSTISREVRRNGGRRQYRASVADARAWDRARRPKPCRLALSPLLRALVAEKLAADWSPQQIAGWLKRTFPQDPCLHVSHETIYLSLFVQSRGVLKKALNAHLRRRRRMRRSKHASTAGQCRGQNHRRRLDSRASGGGSGSGRARPLGRRLTDRRAQLTHRHARRAPLALPALDSSGWQRHRQCRGRALAKAVRTLPKGLMASLTWDRGTEFASHKRFTGRHEREGVLLLRPAESMAARYEREHQRLVAAILPQREQTSRPTRRLISTPSRNVSTHVHARRWGYVTPADTLRPLLH